tara:strand:- start:871 stop:1539 length:669 start_codon:yes stop_codon:yes gene_type:complete
MYKKRLLTLGLMGTLLVASCIKHEVIPAPEPRVDLDAHFEGLIGGSFIEYTENVDGYYGLSELATQSAGGVSNAQYSFSMISPSELPSIKISMGSLIWNDASGATIPALSLFNSFFKANDAPAYSNLAALGFEVTFRDASGLDWKSDELSPTQNIYIDPLSILQESDSKGDFSKFNMTFDCPVYHVYSVIDISVPPTTPSTMRDSIATLQIDQAAYKGWFQR